MLAINMMTVIKISVNSLSAATANNPPNIVTNATNVALKSREFRSSEIKGESKDCNHIETSNIVIISKAFVSMLIVK